jgi:hypothetical protein
LICLGFLAGRLKREIAISSNSISQDVCTLRAELISAINKSFVGRHQCVWPEPVKLPAQVDPSKDERIRAFEALTDAGLLLRGPEVKERFLVGSKVNTYDLSDKGYSSWTPEASQPGYGNFCFGHFNATVIYNATPNDSANPTQYKVTYSYEVLGIPEWVRTPESMRSFPKLAADTSIQSATATLIKGTNGGWAVDSPQSAQ